MGPRQLHHDSPSLLAAMVALGPLSVDMYLPAMPIMMRAFDTDISHMHLTLSSYLAGFAVFHLACGPLADRFGRKPVLIAGTTLFVVACIGCSQSVSVEQMLLFRFLQGVGACVGPTLARAVTRDVFGPTGAARALSLIAMLMALAPAVAPTMGGVLLLILPWQSIFIFLGILFFVAVYLAIRLSRPELLVDPEVFDTVMVYISSLETPQSPVLPSTWAYDSILAGLTGAVNSGLFHTALAWSFGATIAFVLIVVAEAMYFQGFSKTQTASARLFKKDAPAWRIFDFLPGPIKSFTVKEIKTFLRDQTQWSQLFLIAALVIIYVYNFKVLPIDKSPIKTVYLQNLFSFLNMGLALFVLTAITARFAYPAVSMEREAFWLVKSSPLSLRAFLWIKFFIYYLPLLILTEVLIVATNVLLSVTPFMMTLSIVTVFFLVPGIVAMGIGLGAAFPDFKAENPTQTVTSFGGLVFMIVCAGYIGLVILLEAGPVYHLFMADIRGKTLSAAIWLWIIGSFTVAFAFSLAAIALPMRFGENRLSKRLI